MVSPFLKWAGGKRWLITSGHLPIPPTYNKYVEPFLGSGAVFFHLNPKNAVLADLNKDLVCLYKTIKKQPEELYEVMRVHHRRHSESYYYKMRASIPSNDFEKAAKFLYLNRTCWNGLYRVNLKGEFNVPKGSKEWVVFEKDDFFAISRCLKCAKILNSDFEDIIDECEHGDFLFVDPPYTVQHNFNNFRKYNEKIFSWDDQVRLSKAIARAKERGVKIVMTNADHKSIKQLYREICNFSRLKRHSVLAADATKRGPTTEGIFYANLDVDPGQIVTCGKKWGSPQHPR